MVFKFAENICLRYLDGRIELIFVISPFCFVGAWLMVKMFAPGASGSGIPQVLASLNSTMEQPGPLERLLSGRVLGIKILSSSLMALGGAVVGREGPSIQISAAVFYFIKKQWIKLGNKLVLKNMLIAGGASGLAAAFNTPLGGIIYAVEELAKEHVSNFRIGLLEAVITAGLVAQLLNGPYLFLGFPVIPEMQRKSLLAVLLIAIVCGLVGALFGKILFWGLQWRLRLSLKQSFFFVISLSLAFSLIVYFVGPLATGSGKNLITGILFNNQESSALFAAARILGSLLSSLAGAAGGIFAPALASGAATGEWLASILAPNMQNLGPICGMVAFLTGVTRTPVTAFVLILEMTDRHSAIFPMMLAALVAHIFARAVDPKSFYENMAEHLVNQETQTLMSLKQS